MNYKLLALDIDGTILNSKGQLTARTRQAIAQAKKRGVQVMLATGRRLTSTLPIAEELGLNQYLVVHNGAVIYDPLLQKAIFQKGIELSLARELVDKLEALTINYVVYEGENMGERIVAPRGTWNEPEDLLTTYLGERAEFVPEMDLKSPPIRISIIDRTEKVVPLFEQWTANYQERANFLLFGAERHTWRGIEVVPAGCDKGVGVAQVAKLLNIDQKDVVAIGDNVNDLEMILWAGLGIAMENGSASLKARARKIARGHDQDGAAQIIEELLF